MKKLLWVGLLVILFFSKPIRAQWVTIPDPNFASWLNQNYPSCMNGNQMDTTCLQIFQEDSITLLPFPFPPPGNPWDLSGLEYFVNLRFLDCSNADALMLPPLADSLKYLYCTGNQLSTLPNLPSTLEVLNCAYNPILNLPPLPNTLQELGCGGIYLTSLPTLPNNLKKLSLISSGIPVLPVFPISLRELFIFHDQLTNVPVLPDSLLTFQISSSSLLNISSLVLPNTLTSFYCSNNQIYSLPPLPLSLEELFCTDNLLNSLPALPPTLHTLYCNSNNLSTLPTLPDSLQVLVCYDNSLGNLPSLPSSLVELMCQSNNLISLPNIPSNLEWLECYDNNLTGLPPLPNWMVTFDASYNNITCVHNLPDNTSGHINNNPLTCVPNQTSYSLGLPLCIDNDMVNNPNNCLSIVNISGNVFTDENANCTFDSADAGGANIPVKLYDAQNNLVAQNYTVNGIYGFSMSQAGTYTVKLQDSSLPFTVSCAQADSQMVNLISTSAGITNINFPIECNQPYDLFVQSVAQQGWVFPGQVHTLNTNIVNNGTWYNLDCDSSVHSGTVSIDISGPVHYVAPAANALTPQINGNNFIYSVSDFSNLSPESFGLKLMTDTTSIANDSICVHVSISSTPFDNDTANNEYNFCYQVVNSYDPNMKEVYPVNVLPGYEDWFTYTIHFQNTGNAPAFNIRLRDTLDAQLDLSTFQILGYSHPATVSLVENVLTVRFNNIMLADSTTDFEGSLGFFQYRIKPYPNLTLGSQIRNTAYIYFDYNAAVVTNTTQNNFQVNGITERVYSNTEEFIIYPNPSTGVFFFHDHRSVKTLEVFNLMGELVLKQENTGQINLQGMPRGIYVARMNGVHVSRLVKE